MIIGKCQRFSQVFLIFYCITILIKYSHSRLTIPFSENERIVYREKIKVMFYEAYGSYVKNAIDYDELMPISCSGMNTWGTFSLSLIDALDMLAIMNNHTEFKRVAQHILDTADFESNTNVSVFETNIRVVGGLLSAHLLSRRVGFRVDEGWPCSGPLLSLAEKVARKLLPAFETPTGMPYGTVNFQYGVPENETPITCTAGVGTFIVEFGTLSRLTGDPIFEEKALLALEALQRYRSKIGLLGNHINVLDGKWTATDAGIGAGVDSYFEYLVKGSMLLQMPGLIEVFHYDYNLIKNYFKKNDWFIWVSMVTGTATMPIFQSLEAFFPGLLTLIGDLDQAKKSLYNYHQVWKQYGFVPEFYDIVKGKHHKREGYPLRPEFIESVFYLYQATKDRHLLSIGADVVDSIYYSARTECGYATIKSVSDHTIEDRMESFFLAETLKYLYLLFDEDNFINENGSFGTVIQLKKEKEQVSRTCVIESGGYVFNTEAHPIDIAALSCCYDPLEDQNPLDFTLDLSDMLVNDGSFRTNKWNIPKANDQLSSGDPDLVVNLTQTLPETYLSVTIHGDLELFQTLIEVSKTENGNEQPSKIETSFGHREIQTNKPTILSESTIFENEKIENQTDCSHTISNNQLPPQEEQLYRQYSAIPSSSMDTISSLSNVQTINASNVFVEVMESSTSPSQESKINDEKEENTENVDEGDDKLKISKKNKSPFEIYGDPELYSCPSQSFLLRLSLYGQMFE